MLYDTIYDFFYDIFNSNYINAYELNIMGVNTNLVSWLSNTTTIVLLGLGIWWLIMVVRWIFRVCAGLLKW